MKSKTAQRIIEQTPQEVKNRVRVLTNRELELLQMGFTHNANQTAYILFKYDSNWYVDFWKLSDYTDHKWNILMEDIKYDLEMVKKQYYDDLKRHSSYNFAQKQFKKVLRDKYNHLNSQLKTVNILKLDKTVNQELRIKLENQIELIKWIEKNS